MKFSLQQTLKNGVKHNSKALILTMAKMTLRAQKEWVFTPKNVGRMLTLLKRLQESFRLMVGVPDYATYLAHMAEHHPELTPMDEKTFFRHCVDARYPSGGTMKRCPC